MESLAWLGVLAVIHEKQQQIVQTSKLASIAELAMGVAHEINNPLNNILLLAGNWNRDADEQCIGQ
jgi:C4-dicarboxylate-specific signal transduction histidine kinase